jgi:hypothetical protein
MALYEQYRDDLLNRFASHSFTETPVGSMTLVEFFDSVPTLVASSQKLTLVDAYRSIREDLVGLRSEIMITVSEVQRDAWTGTPALGEGPIYNETNTAELYDGVAWTPV